jgi:hypothetical protein
MRNWPRLVVRPSPISRPFSFTVTYERGLQRLPETVTSSPASTRRGSTSNREPSTVIVAVPTR